MELEELVYGSGKPSTLPLLTLEDLVYGKGELGDSSPGLWSKTLAALEILGRPQLALGEALGAYARKEPVGEAAMRGLRGERKYGTPGEQLLPDEPETGAMESLARATGRLGIDIATDPTWLLGAGVAKAVGGPAARLLSKIPIKKLFPRQLARHALPMTTQLRHFGRIEKRILPGGKAVFRNPGAKTAELLEEADKFFELRTGVEARNLEEKARTLGLLGRRSRPLREAAVDHLETGALRSGITHPDSRVQEFARYIDDTLQRIGTEVEGFRDPKGEHFWIVEPVLRSVRRDIVAQARKLKLNSVKWRDAVWAHVSQGVPPPAGAPAGFAQLASTIQAKLGQVGYRGGLSPFDKNFYRRPFRRIPNYFPQMPTDDWLTSLGTDEGFSKAAKEIATLNGISEFEASEILRKIAQPRRAGNIEYARTLKMLNRERDPLKVLPRYFEQVYGRTEYARRFGVAGGVLDDLLKRTVTKRVQTPTGFRTLQGLSATDAQLIRRAILGHPPERSGLERIARGIMGYQVMTKMGPLSAISNFSQNVNTAIMNSGTDFVKGVLRSTTKEGTRQGAIAYERGIRDILEQIASSRGPGAKWWLEWSGFSPVERTNRILAANTGIVTAERLIRQSKGTLTRELTRRGLTSDDLARTVANNWKLPESVADKVGLIGSNLAQHVTRFKDLPLSWQTPEMKLFVQFKSFVFQQTRFILREILSPAFQHFKTNGKEGTLAPLMRAVVGFGLGGQVVAHLRDQAQTLSAKLLRMEHDPREPIPDDWAVRVLADSLGVGGLGIAGDLLGRVARRDFKGWLVGPTLGDISDLAELVGGTAIKGYKTGELDLSRFGPVLMRRVPLLAPILPRGQELKQGLEETIGSLEELVYGK